MHAARYLELALRTPDKAKRAALLKLASDWKERAEAYDRAKGPARQQAASTDPDTDPDKTPS
ncbi:hypothetical protein NK718_09640 [Alsobacter sp. SYSU M60028]|uniref:Uncharacterized protein n=1 Tax=Alsobacter ponti TaxID=2962936 RepID=A0ABT1LBB0_9HYPH|nr:hypothetical protein [Alsobacter ponti]MCP8938775.1 hypothetical protein [Alsobacter ponti]